MRMLSRHEMMHLAQSVFGGNLTLLKCKIRALCDPLASRMQERITRSSSGLESFDSLQGVKVMGICSCANSRHLPLMIRLAGPRV